MAFTGTLGMVLNSVLNQQKSTRRVPEFHTVKYRPFPDAFFGGFKGRLGPLASSKEELTSSKEELMAIACSRRIYNGQVDR